MILTGFIVLSCAVSTGCGSNESEAETRQRERADLEERARMDAEAANRAITEMNQRMFGGKQVETVPAAEGLATSSGGAETENATAAETSPAPKP